MIAISYSCVFAVSLEMAEASSHRGDPFSSQIIEKTIYYDLRENFRLHIVYFGPTCATINVSPFQ